MNSKTKRNKTYANVKVQPPILVLIHIVLAFVLTKLIPLPLAVPQILHTGGFILVILGFLLGLGALLVFRRARTVRSSDRSATRLITFGIYRFTRNPIYLGFLLMLIGMLLNAGSYWGILLAPIMVILFNRLVIEQEEENLAQAFGDEYRSYRVKVRRWL